MIRKAIQITIFVRDIEKAKKFYTESLGFVIVDEEEFAPGWIYLTVSPQKHNETVLELVKADTPEHEALIGKQAGEHIIVMFESDDIEADYKNMKTRGVVFHGEPKSVPGGKGVGFQDLYGNQFDLFEKDESFKRKDTF
ncbi:VOC family protein [Evansella halocellulosilytica]|uniref:VOC family protein n=1 Tax=Evansella halocellulosilytica TaxID=2011013 RepID=UPI000BB73988|nr:VOC family protein [Evansella halocellulosilytica]